MASPQRRDPQQLRQTPREVPPPGMENLREVERQIGTGGAFNWWWLWIPVVIAAFWFVGWGWGPYGGWWWGHGAESAKQSANSSAPAAPNTSGHPANGALAGGFGNTTVQATGPGVALLNAADKKSAIGHNFQVQDVSIERRASANAVWIGVRAPMLLVLPAAQQVNTSPGTGLDVSGIITKAPPAAQARQQWSLNKPDVSRLENEGAYIQATSVATAHP